MQNLNNDHQGDNSPKLSLGQKLGVVGLSFLAVMIVFLWIFNLNKNIQGPGATRSVSTEDPCPGGDCFSDQSFQEFTSSFEGSFDDEDIVDGFDTDEELDFIVDYESERGDDPTSRLGAEDMGVTGSLGQMDLPTTTTSTVDDFDSLDFENDLDGQEMGLGETEIMSIIQGEGDAETLREVLLQSGVADSEFLDQVSDEDLMSTYQETLGQ